MGERYPRTVAVDFRKMEAPALHKYCDHFGIQVKADTSPQELATAVAKHFEKEPVDEDSVLNDFLFTHMEKMSNLLKLDKKRKRVDLRNNGNVAPLSRKEARLAQQHAAKADEEVAVRDVGGGWILARVVRYLADRDSYEVRDEDGSKVLILSSSSVRRLEDSVSDIQKNDVVLAVFPDTTSFYRAVVSKVKKLSGPQPQEVVVKFEDDEDETGRTPQRYVPARYILRLNQVGQQPQSAHDHDGYSEPGGKQDGGGSRKNGSGKYRNMIIHALNKLPHGEGTLGQIYKIIEADFHDELQWKLEGDFKKGPVWKSMVRKSLANPKNGFHMETSGEKAIYSLRDMGDEP